MPIILQCDAPGCAATLMVQMHRDCTLELFRTGWWIVSGTPHTVCACSTAHLSVRAAEKLTRA
jgi:hypothetical protein